MKFTCLKTDRVNSNGRVYPKDMIIKTINSSDFQHRLKHKQLVGYTIDQPRLKDAILSEASHVITDIELEDDTLVGEIEILDTPNGKMLSNLIKNNNGDFGMALRGRGEVNKDGVVESLHIVSFDYVYKPSYKGE